MKNYAQRPRNGTFMCAFMTVIMTILLSSPVRSETRIDYQGIYEMQALFLYNFANFVEWPETAFPADGSPVKLCLFGGVPLDTFVRVFDGTLIRDRELAISQTHDINDIIEGCQILFVGFDKREFLDSFFADIKHIFVLSVSAIEEFAREGGVVSIHRNSDQMQIEVNLDTAIKNGLYISSDLLSIARVLE